jgi:nicotinamidase-related amidase
MKALLVVDVQVGNFGEGDSAVENEKKLLETINGLIAKARKYHVAVVFTQHESTKGNGMERLSGAWKLHPDLLVNREKDLFVSKRNDSAFHETGLAEKLRNWGVGEVVVCGICTEYQIDATVRHGFAKDFRMVLVADAHSTKNYNGIDAQHIIEHHNRVLANYATLTLSGEITF